MVLATSLIACHGEPPTAAAQDAGSEDETRGSKGIATWPSYVGDRFAIQMPGVPVAGPAQVAESESAGMVMRAYTYVMPDSTAQYGIVTLDFPTVPGDIQPMSALYMAVHDRVLKGLNAKVVSDVPGTFYSHSGHAVELERPSVGGEPGGRISGRFIASGRRVYFVSVMRQTDALPPGVAEAFLGSFHLVAD
jgi:hypothetical protein